MCFSELILLRGMGQQTTTHPTRPTPQLHSQGAKATVYTCTAQNESGRPQTNMLSALLGILWVLAFGTW
jgi:hypothetical protein